jgi:prostatic aicd phosphatase
LVSQTLVNGTEADYPLNGYQFIQVHAESEEEPDAIWIKGDDACPAYTTASASYKDSEQYMTTLESTRDFYSQFTDMLNNTPVAGNVSFTHAYDVFDLINVGTIHNESIAEAVTPEQLKQLRILADESEWGHNYNQTMPDRSIGGRTLAGAFLKQLNATVSSAGKLKFSLMAGSYDTFLAFFGLTNLTAASLDFMAIPDYASSIAVELYTDADMISFPSNETDLRVRFLFHNGSGVAGPDLTVFPLFGQDQLNLGYTDFVQMLSERAINDPAQWCEVCGSDEGFCQQSEYSSEGSSSAGSNISTGLSTTEAGVVGAMVTLGVFLVGALAFWLIMRRRNRDTNAMPPLEKHTSDSGESGSKLSA